MPRTCTVCAHEARRDIEVELVQRKAYRNIAKQFLVSPAALSRHANDHIAPKIAKIRDEEDVRCALEGQRGLKDRKNPRLSCK